MNKTFQIHLRVESELASALTKEAMGRQISFSELCREKLMENSRLAKIEFILEDMARKFNIQLNSRGGKMKDKYIDARRNAIKVSKTDEELDTVLNGIYDDGFEDGSNED